jgi:peptidyl-prolyl cis-trans isomerase SurA
MTDCIPVLHWRLAGALLVAMSCLAAGNGQAQTLKATPSRAAPDGLSLRLPPSTEADRPTALDFIVAVVDNEPITNREVNQLAAMVDPAANTSKRVTLLQEALETLINETAQLQVARQTNLQISVGELEQAIENTAQRNQISVDEMQKRLQAQGIGWERYRQQIKRQLLLQRVREREVIARVKVTDQEVEAFLQDGNKGAGNGPFNIHIAHILVALPEKATNTEVTQAFDKAQALLRQAKAGEDFAQLAARNSQAPDRANGGQLGLRSPDRYPSLFVEAVANLPVGGLVGPLRSGAGFHVLKLLERQSPNALPATVTQTRARHILLRPGNQLSQDAARAQLAGFRRQIQSGFAKFEDLAQQHSQDGSATKGGDLGWANPGTMVPEFERVMDALRPGEVSDPVVSRFGVHLIEVLERREEPLTLRDKQEMARNLLRERKFEDALKNWERETRGRAYVEYRESPQ